MLETVANLLKVQNYAADQIEIVLRIAEKLGVQPVALQAEGKPGIEAIVCSPASLHGKRVSARLLSLWLLVRKPNQYVSPRFPAALAPGDSCATGEIHEFDVFAIENLRSKAGEHVALDA